MKTHTIKITEKDIRTGQHNIERNEGECAIGLAFARTFKKYKAAQWFFDRGRLDNKTALHTNRANKTKIAKFVDKHDSLKKVRPFNFEMFEVESVI